MLQSLHSSVNSSGSHLAGEVEGQARWWGRPLRVAGLAGGLLALTMAFASVAYSAGGGEAGSVGGCLR